MKKLSKPLIIANWKTNPSTLKEGIAYLKSLEKEYEKTKNMEPYLIACPESYIGSLAALAKHGVIGAQNISGIGLGATTGATTPTQLASSGAEFAIIGHSEVRARGETIEQIAKKAELSTLSGMLSVICLGEQERDSHGHYLTFLEQELLALLAYVDKKLYHHIVIAYEPVWAIGKEEAATTKECFEVVVSLRRALANAVGIDNAKKVRILYGGTVTRENASDFLTDGGVDGLLIGRTSLDVKAYASILKK